MITLLAIYAAIITILHALTLRIMYVGRRRERDRTIQRRVRGA